MKKLAVLACFLMLFAVGCEQEVMEEPLETEIDYDTAPPAPGAPSYNLEEDWDLASWDADGNQELSREEWASGFEARYAAWDPDGDGAIGPDEAADTWRDWFDGNDDDIIDSDEWNTGVETFAFDNVDYGEMSAWDTDGNGEISADEWRAGYESTVWTAWDADASGDLSRDEIDDPWWAFFDGNDDDIIDSDEWGRS